MAISSTQLKELLNYKFVGVDESFLYYHCQIKYWDKLLQYIPAWVAPNTITLIGFIAMAMQAGLVWYFDSEMTGNVRWLPAVSAIVMWFYSTMDCLDGMQARKTGAKSPLGQLFDHGVDSIVCTFIIYCISSAVGLREKKNMFFILLCAHSIFYWVTIKEYYTKVFYLGLIGPTESIALGCIFLLAISAIGKERLLFFHPWIKNNLSMIVKIASSVIGLAATIYYIVHIALETGFSLQAEQLSVKYIKIFPHMIFISIQLLTIASVLNADSIESPLVFYPYLSIVTANFSLFTTWTIFSHQLSMYIQIPITCAFLLLMANLVLVCMPAKKTPIFIHMLTGLSLIKYFLTIKSIISGCLSVLNIPFFFNNYSKSS
ncbi:ethanolaminephosphotransferase [Nematocida sp. ERTm5]|nr:ethanolaminephosphotransferase [Nematocida sp. ERTm5]